MTTAPVPDDIVIPMVLKRLQQPDVKERGYVLDGFPRNARQHAALAEAGFSPVLAIMLQAPRETLSRRIRYRRLDPETDALYNLKLRPPASQEVLERLVVLAKDSAANVAQLFESYGRATTETYDLLVVSAVRVDANRLFDDVHNAVSKAVGDLGVRPLLDDDQSGLDGGMPSPPPPRTIPTVVTPPDAIARTSAEREAQVEPVRKPMSAAAALRARRWRNNDGDFNEKQLIDEDNFRSKRSNSSNEGNNNAKGSIVENEDVGVGTKAKITLIRCDGYICERESVEESQIAFRGAATEQVMLMWNVRPRTVFLLVKKDPELMKSVLEAAKYLSEVESLNVLVEGWVQTEALANGMFLNTFSKPEVLHESVDFVVCLGGDGLILHVSTLFKTAVPPVVSFNLGSLGFLTPFQFDDFRAEIQALLRGDCNLSLRMRLSCQIIRNNDTESKQSDDINGGKSRRPLRTTEMFPVLNEVVVDRGASPYLSNLDCFCDGKYITTVQADGIIMSTPTGSTAYSMSAGGSMVHPSVPAILFTPICPHSLSFRPIVFPDSAELRIEIAEDSRSTAWASFDGKSRQQLRRGDGLVVKMNLFPVPTVNKTDHTGDWFQSLDRAFNFNSRAGQKPLRKMTSAVDDGNADGDDIHMDGNGNDESLSVERTDGSREGLEEVR